MKNLLASAALTVGLSTAPALADSNNTSPSNINQAIDTSKEKVSLICNKEKSSVIAHTGAKLSAEQLLAECRAKFETPEETTQSLRDSEIRGEYREINPQEYYVHSAPVPIKGLVKPEFVELELIPSEQFISPALASTKQEVSNLIARVGEQGVSQNEWNNLLMDRIDTLSDETKNVLNAYLDSIDGKLVNEELVSKTLREILTITLVKPTQLQDQDTRLLALSQGISTVLYSLDYPSFNSMQRVSKINDEGYNIVYLGKSELELLTNLGVVFSDKDIEYYNSQLHTAVSQMGTKEELYTRYENGNAEQTESIDYAQVQDKFISFFLNEKLATRFGGEFLELPIDLQSMMLSNFQSASEYLDPNTTDRNKHKFAINLLKTFQEVEKKEGSAESRFGIILKSFPELSGTQFANNITLIAKEADYTEGVNVDFTPEQKLELARLKESIQTSQNNIQTSHNNIKEYDKLNGIGTRIAKNND